MNKLIKTIITLGIGAALTFGIMSAGNFNKIDVDPSFKILVDGEEFKPKAVNGNDVMIFQIAAGISGWGILPRRKKQGMT